MHEEEGEANKGFLTELVSTSLGSTISCLVMWEVSIEATWKHFSEESFEGEEREEFLPRFSPPSSASQWLNFASLGVNFLPCWHCFLAPLGRHEEATDI